VLDGAHTGESAAALAATLRAVFPDAPLAFVVAMAADKEHAAVLQQLRAAGPAAIVFTAAAIAGSMARSAPPGLLQALRIMSCLYMCTPNSNHGGPE
jgi:folylpolyglutamate synthase/dihydropteroate synthase